MTIKNQSKRPRAMGEGEPVIEVISQLDRIITYPDGLVIHETKNRPYTLEDTKWLIAMVADLAPYIMATNSKEAEGKATGISAAA